MFRTQEKETPTLSSINKSEEEEYVSPTSNDSFGNLKQKRISLKTPHPKKYANDYEETNDETSSNYKKTEYLLTTQDNSFISGATEENKSKRTSLMDSCAIRKNIKFVENRQFQIFKSIDKISDYFINFDKLRKNSLKLIKNKNFLNSLNKSKTNSDSNNSLNSENSTPAFGSISPTILNEVYEDDDENYSDESSQSDEFYSNKKNKIISHPILPQSKIDDEVYKSKMIADMKIHRYNTDTHKFILFRKRKISEVENTHHLDYTILKKRKISSVKKIYQSVVPLFNDKDEMVLFPIYRDEDIGIKTEWRGHLTLQKFDNDQETDDEIRNFAIFQSLKAVNQGIQYVKTNKDILKNRKLSPSYKNI